MSIYIIQNPEITLEYSIKSHSNHPSNHWRRNWFVWATCPCPLESDEDCEEPCPEPADDPPSAAAAAAASSSSGTQPAPTSSPVPFGEPDAEPNYRLMHRTKQSIKRKGDLPDPEQEHVGGLRQCAMCHEQGYKFQVCSRCLNCRYCSRECQRRHWITHKLICRSALEAQPEQEPDVPATSSGVHDVAGPIV